MSRPKLTQYKVLMFDVYGTLVDWETGILQALEPVLAGTPLAASREAALTAFLRVEQDLQARHPTMRYSELLALAYAELDARAHTHRASPAPGAEPALSAAATAFGQSIGAWPVFADTPSALARLRAHTFQLTVLSNVDRASFARTQRALGAFAAVYTAEDARAYKPDPRARAYALRALGVPPAEVLVVAGSVAHDIAPARAMGLATAWIARAGSVIGWDEEEGRKADWVFGSLGEMAEAVEREVRGES